MHRLLADAGGDHDRQISGALAHHGLDSGPPAGKSKAFGSRLDEYLPLEEKTIADAFHSGGYATASIGKWHLGGEQYYPDKHGFDVNIAGTSAANPTTYFAPYNIATLAEGPKGEYLTDRLGDEVLKFIEEHKDKPFFVYFPHFAVHLPIQGKQEIIESIGLENNQDRCKPMKCMRR